MRIAEPAFGADAGLQLTPFAELEATIESDGVAGCLGQGFHHIHQSIHELRRAAVVVSEENCKPGFPLDQRSHIHLAL